VSVAHPERLRERLPAYPESIGLLRRTVVDFADTCGACERQREDIAIAVSEALTNVVKHAYVDRDTPGDITVQAFLRGRALVVEVCDEGVGMRTRDSHGVGSGLRIMFRLTDRLEFTDTMSGARVRMTFAIG
jgi:serine/threonine-protein kinase RsbW